MIENFEKIRRCAMMDYSIKIENSKYPEDTFMSDARNRIIQYLFEQRKTLCKKLVEDNLHETTEALALFEYVNKEIIKNLDL